MECAEEVLVNEHRFIVTLVCQTHLFEETFFLVDAVIELGVSICQFLTVHHQFETLGQTSFFAVHLRERRHFHRIVCDESGLNELTFTSFTEDFINELTFTHCFVYLDAEFFSDGTDFIFGLAIEVVARFFLDSIKNGKTTIRSFEANHLTINFRFRFAIHCDANFLQHTFGEIHHPVVVLILHIAFHTGKLGIVRAVHTLVAEVLTDFIDSFKTTHDETFEIKLCCNAAIHLLAQRVEVCDKGSRRRTTRNILECWCFHFCVTRFVQDATHCSNHLSALVEGFLHVGIDNQVYIATTVAQFRIFKGVKHLTILLLRTRERFQTLSQKGQFAHVHRDFSCFGAEHIAFHPNEVTQIEEFLH